MLFEDCAPQYRQARDEVAMSEDRDTKARRPSPKSEAKPEALQAAAEPASMAASAEPQIVPQIAAAPPPVVALPPSVLPAEAQPRQQNAADELFSAYRDTFLALGESQRAVASGIRALALEMAGLARANLTVAGESAVALAGASNFTDAVEIQLGFARRGFDVLVSGSTRIGEIGARLASDASRPIVAPLAGLSRAG
jgi:hypothetical protein